MGLYWGLKVIETAVDDINNSRKMKKLEELLHEKGLSEKVISIALGAISYIHLKKKTKKNYLKNIQKCQKKNGKKCAKAL